MALTAQMLAGTMAHGSLLDDPFVLPAFRQVSQNSTPSGAVAEFVESIGPASLDDVAELKRRYASLIIYLDRLRPALEASALLHPEDGAWSIKETLGHLIDTDHDIWWPRIEMALREERPYFADLDQHAIAQAHNWQSQPIAEILSQLTRARWNYAMKLNAIPLAEFKRSGEHAVLGEICILRIAQILVAHDEYYLAKIRSMIGKAETLVL